MSIISTEELTKKFGEVTAVDHVSFAVERGEVFAFLGPNGAGKSTTIKMLTTLLTPTSGRMEVAGHDPWREAAAVRRTFGIIFQDPSLDTELTAYENMELHGVLYHLPRASRRSRIEELLTFLELWDRRTSLVKEFSGGMKRRLEIARGLLHHPSILFLKDLNAREHTTVFFTTHYMDEAERIAQRIAVIDHGRIVAQGSPGELKRQTNTQSLEDAFLALTGKTIREEGATSLDQLRMQGRLWRGR